MGIGELCARRLKHQRRHTRRPRKVTLLLLFCRTKQLNKFQGLLSQIVAEHYLRSFFLFVMLLFCCRKERGAKRRLARVVWARPRELRPARLRQEAARSHELEMMQHTLSIPRATITREYSSIAYLQCRACLLHEQRAIQMHSSVADLAQRPLQIQSPHPLAPRESQCSQCVNVLSRTQQSRVEDAVSAIAGLTRSTELSSEP